MRMMHSILTLALVTTVAACGSNTDATTQAPSSSATQTNAGQPAPTGAATGGTATAATAGGMGCSPNATTVDPNATRDANTVTPDPNTGLHAFFEIGSQEFGSAIARGLWVVLTRDANYCVPSSSVPGLTIAPVKQGSVSMSVQLPAPIKGDTNGTFLGAKDYPAADISVDTHSADATGWPQTCVLFGGGDEGKGDLNIKSFNADNTAMDFTLDANVAEPVHFAGTAHACNLMTANPTASPGYGNATWIEGNLVNCTP